MKAAVSVVTVLAAMLFATSAQAKTVHCGDAITSSITVSNNLSGCAGDGLVIGRDGIVVDLRGHTITGDGMLDDDSGINLNHHHGVIVQGGAVKTFGVGVRVSGDDNQVRYIQSFRNGTGLFIDHGDGNRVVQSSQVANGYFGLLEMGGAHNVVTSLTAKSTFLNQIVFSGGHDNAIVRVNSETSNTGIAIDNETGDTISDTRVRRFNLFGIQVRNGSTGTTLARNLVFSGRPVYGTLLAVGFDIRDSSDTTVGRNEARDVAVGFRASNAQGATFTSNFARYDDGPGFVIDGGTTNATLTRNLAGSTHRTSAVTGEGNFVGITVGDSTGTRLDHNSANHSRAGDGISIGSAALSPQLIGNGAAYNAGNGITVDSASAALTGNAAARNAGFGIFAVPGVTDGGGNHASGNVAGQCTNVFCS